MPDRLPQLFEGFERTGRLSIDATAFLRFHGRDEVARHVELVAENARRLASREHLDEHAAVTAALLHDISMALPVGDMLATAIYYDLPVLPEERQVPFLLHGKLSALIAERMFEVHAPVILGAMRCHTTLRAQATVLDKVLFIADKLSWAPHEAPYHAALTAALDRSLDQAVWCFLDWSMQQAHPVIHPWLRQAHAEAQAANNNGAPAI